MIHRPYLSYKDSGFEWLGEVPAHWDVKRLKYLASNEGRPGIQIGPFGGMLTDISYGDSGHYKVFGQENVLSRNFEIGSRWISFDQYSDLKGYGAKPGDLLFTRKGSIGACCVVPEDVRDGIIDSDTIRLIIDSNIVTTKYILQSFHYSKSLQDQIQLTKRGAILSGLNTSTIENLVFPVPPLAEQEAIAAFLDCETAKIDGLVSEQERLINLLKEKRHSVVSSVVTRGLDPTVSLKFSGVEWLGQVPEHWEVAPLTARYHVQLGKMLDTAKITGNHLRPYLRVADVQWGAINTAELPEMDFDESDRERFLLKRGDLLINEGGSYPGRSAIWNGEIPECYYQKALHRVRARSKSVSSTHHLYYLINFASNLGVFSAGGNEATIEHLPAEKLRRYRFAFPPRTEQEAITAYLNKQTARFDALVAEAQLGIELLVERRMAIISAAVTGKIDVRESI